MTGYRDRILLEAEQLAATLQRHGSARPRRASGAAFGEELRHKAGTGERFWQFREYVPGDRPQDIDWRQSAKGSRVFVREKEQQAAQIVYLWAQGGESMDFASRKKLPTKADRARILALALGMALSRKNALLSIPGTEIRPSHTRKNFERIAEILCTGATFPDSAVRLQALSKIALFGDFLDEIPDSFKALAAQSGSGLVVQILDPAEIDLPYDGRVRFTHGANAQQIENVTAIRAEYRARIDRHCAALADLCRHLGWQYILHRTDDDPSALLSEILLTEEDI